MAHSLKSRYNVYKNNKKINRLPLRGPIDNDVPVFPLFYSNKKRMDFFIRTYSYGLIPAELGIRSYSCGVIPAELGIRSYSCGVMHTDLGMRSYSGTPTRTYQSLPEKTITEKISNKEKMGNYRN